MSLSLSSLKGIPVSFATCSIGCRDDQTLPQKINALAAAGFTGIELSMPDLTSFASMHLRHEVGPKDFDDLCTAARVLKAMCDTKEITIMLMQPFANFEGWAEGSEERKDSFERVEGWIKIMLACGCETLQVGSSDTPEEKIGLDRSRFVKDLQKLCDMLSEHKLRLAYENWCWSTHAPGWKDVWDIIRQVDRPNAGLCLDTFQTGGGEWGDPRTESGIIEVQGKGREDIERDFHASMEELSRTVPADKIYLLQISDAYKLKTPITSADEEGLRPRGRWSHDYRPIPFNGGYLPVVDVAKAVLKTGFRGWFSYEVFDSGPDGNGKDYELKEFADAAFACQEKLLSACSD